MAKASTEDTPREKFNKASDELLEALDATRKDAEGLVSEMANALDEAEEATKNAKEDLESERAEVKELERKLDTIPDMLKDVERGSHSLDEVIQRVRDFEFNR